MKPWQAWLTFLACLCVLTGAMSFTTWALLRIDSDNARQAEVTAEQEAIRKALWRMDAAVADLVADEAARPYFEYSAFYPAEGAYTRMFSDAAPGELLVPSPLLAYETPLVRLHFQVGPDGVFTSPQVPTGPMRETALRRYLRAEQADLRAAQLASVQAALQDDHWRRQLPRRKAQDGPLPAAVFADEAWAAQNMGNVGDYQERQQNTQNKADRRRHEVMQSQADVPTAAGPIPIAEHPTTALWIGAELYLARLVSLDTREYAQVCWLNWGGVRDALAAAAVDILPEPTFASADDYDADHELRLASLPVRVIPGPVIAQPIVRDSPVRFALWVAWGAVLMAALAVGMVLRSTVSLSERRADFVSAVTHELRTPLTTLRMYAEMLSGGQVKDEKARADYLDTMHAESIRLSHLVENVLSYARLERGSQARTETVLAGELLSRARPALAERARQAGMQLAVSLAPGLDDVVVRADPAGVERILFNLVDNACKYSGTATDKRVEVSASRSDTSLHIQVRDYGPGIEPTVARKLFQPFRKSAQAAAGSAPGVGLGLSLCRGLARAMGGELSHIAGQSPGACFDLELPLA